MLRVDDNATLHSVAGTGVPGYDGNGVLANTSRLIGPLAVTASRNGSLVFMYVNAPIRLVTKSLIWDVVGNGSHGYSGDGGDALLATMSAAYGLAYHEESDTLYFSDLMHHAVRARRSNGLLERVAGQVGVAGMTVLGEKADTTFLNYPVGLHVTTSGDLYIANVLDSSVLRIDAAKRIYLVAGSGSELRDGAPMTNSTVGPNHVVSYVSRTGQLFVSDGIRYLIRIGTNNSGMLTIAGGGTDIVNEDVPATTARLSINLALAVDDIGATVWFSDMERNRTRFLYRPGMSVHSWTNAIDNTSAQALVTMSTWGTPLENTVCLADASQAAPFGDQAVSAGFRAYAATTQSGRVTVLCTGQT
ncbi:hypothetical protein EON62_00110, partial [archaeon]